MQLLYRGVTYHYSPNPVAVACPMIVQSRTLFYRGNQYTAKPQPLQFYRQPAAINWRFQVSDSHQNALLNPAHN